MYCSFYGLDKNPFDLAPAGGLLYLSESHREALAILRYGVIAGQGFLLLTGGVGTGKTSVLNTLLKLLKDSVQVHVLNNPALSRNELYYYLSGILGFKSQRNKGAFLLEFNRLLDTLKSEGKKLLLIIDEAQAFSVGLLEEVRLLSNHSGDRNVLSIFLIGQPELQEVLAEPRLLPMRQRIGVRYHLEPLSRDDTEQYIIYRLNKAGASNPAIFEGQAIDAIHIASKGTPRLINVICDNALILGYSLDARRIDRKMVEDAVREIKLPGERELQISTPLDKATIPSFREKRHLWPAAVAVSALLALAVAGSVLYVLSLQGRLPPQLQTIVNHTTEFVLDVLK
jgi:general secretion pathway protein A